MGLLSRLLGPSRSGTARREVSARYDAAQTSELNRRHWQAADTLSADSALTPAVRQRLRSRARYEAANNGYLAGMTNTRATDLVGTGPRLLLDCGPDADQELVSIVEDNVYEWGQATALAAKLRTMSIAKAIDGESFAVITNNSALRGVQLDLRLVEAEMVADPRVVARVQREIDATNAQYGQWEKVKKFALTPDVWSIAAGHVTPTLKLRRKPILQMYEGLYEGLYEEASN